MVTISKSDSKSEAHIYLALEPSQLNTLKLTPAQTENIKDNFKKKIRNYSIELKGLDGYVVMPEKKKEEWQSNEEWRRMGNAVLKMINKYKLKTVTITNLSGCSKASWYFAEGMGLGNYQFIRHKKEAAKLESTLKEIRIDDETVTKADVQFLNIEIETSTKVKDLVNEPVNILNAPALANAFVTMGKEAGFKVEVWNKKKIETMKFGGLLAVNQGSVDEPRFTVMEYKPSKPVNKKPIVLVGKGVVYDTGGLSLKPTLNSMDYMKDDMAGAATMAGVVYMAAKTKMPLHIIALAPSTDNRPGFNAFAPGDIITMYDGTTVEMLNSDAEGRMILADALAYAKNYNPELVIDLATLTGAAHHAVGDHGIAYMGTADTEIKQQLEESGYEVYERLIQFYLWEEYGQSLYSEIADMKNVGGNKGGHITAGKFLEHFTDYPWLHIDIAGSAFLHKRDSYRGVHATAQGLRLIYTFLQKRINHK